MSPIASALVSTSVSLPSQNGQKQLPSESWIRSIDNVYSLFQDAQVAAQYPSLSLKVESAVRLCEAVITDVGWQHCALSFNGGKDCTVLVHILAAVLRKLNRATPALVASSTSFPLLPIPSLYISCPSPFPTLEKFITYCTSPVHGYNLDLVAVSASMKQGIKTYLDGGGIPYREPFDNTSINSSYPTSKSNSPLLKREVRAFFVGTRRDDPHGPLLSPRSWTDADWPRVERIHPILDWTYKDVWDFLRCPHLGAENVSISTQDLTQRYGVAGGGNQGVPYCLLYEQGYTSLGSTFNTLPNPVLRISDQDASNGSFPLLEPVVVGDGTAKGRWKPAYMLPDGRLERAGRQDQNKHLIPIISDRNVPL